MTPHPPYDVFSAKLRHARELTKFGAEKRTFHFDLHVTEHPVESGNEDFVVGGTILVCVPNEGAVVDEIFDLLHVPKFLRDRRVLLSTKDGRWPTIWSDEKPREMVTIRQELLTWCPDVQSYPSTKSLPGLLAVYAEAENERKILMLPFLRPRPSQFLRSTDRPTHCIATITVRLSIVETTAGASIICFKHLDASLLLSFS